MGTGSFTGVRRPGRGVDHPFPSSTEVKERVLCGTSVGSVTTYDIHSYLHFYGT
jgi:hypothetical protein